MDEGVFTYLCFSIMVCSFKTIVITLLYLPYSIGVHLEHCKERITQKGLLKYSDVQLRLIKF